MINSYVITIVTTAYCLMINNYASLKNVESFVLPDNFIFNVFTALTQVWQKHRSLAES